MGIWSFEDEKAAFLIQIFYFGVSTKLSSIVNHHCLEYLFGFIVGGIIIFIMIIMICYLYGFVVCGTLKGFCVDRDCDCEAFASTGATNKPGKDDD